MDMDIPVSTQSLSQAKPRVLVVEDDPFLHDLYVDLLNTEGYIVSSAVDGEEAFQKIHDGGFDLILLDIMLPKKDGVEIVTALKTDPPKIANKKIVFLTNMGQESIIKNGQDYGVSGYLIKSALTPDQFVDAVKKYLA